MQKDNDGLVYAYCLNGAQKGQTLNWSDLETAGSEGAPAWIHLDYTSEKAQQWLNEKSGLDQVIIDGLLCDETSPRCTRFGQGALLTLRGVNLAPNSDPEDMVSIRIWIEPYRIISTRKRRLLSAQDIVEQIEQGAGPTTVGEFIVMLTDRLISRMQGTLHAQEETIASLEEKVIDSASHSLRSDLADLRRQAIVLRRYLSPQREAMQKLISDRFSFISDHDYIHLRQTSDHLLRYIEDLDSIRERASITQDEIASAMSEQMNNRMYMLSIVAAIFLPLGFLTGLLGINVGGMPGADNSDAFWIVAGLMTLIAALQVVFLRFNRWF
ncbi:zinc transporter ZntB [Litoribrevibacter albus]|uniref:Zinc transporter ZntB n=1 Tax=Litoribrevibacter albus TaxID=1473156 RepID=A0AA37SCN7_9GAMM|nr:zinc transporter ZntB [Litoribrevibacter albus]GLQ32588.1 zinc transporter ZntB [Litoribrevibacter albus]